MSDATARENRYDGAPATFGYLETDGSTLIDRETGETVRIVGVNWHGAEGETKLPGGLWQRSYKHMMEEMVEQGLNTIRIPISPAILDPDKITSGIRWDANPDLRGLDALGVMDKIVDYAEDIGLRIVLDMHRITPGVGKQESGLWFSNSYSEADLIDDWQKIAKHYSNNPTVIGFDVFNEPSGDAHWAEDGTYRTDWHRAATDIGNAILDVNSDALIFVEGNHIVDNEWYWVGGNLRGAEDDPIELDQADRLVYSPHDYPYSVQNVPWLENASRADMIENFEKHWGYLYESGAAPVVLGEIGALLYSNADTRYLDALFDYIEDTQASSSDGVGVLWWTWGPNSGDTGGLLKDWYTINEAKVAYLDRLDGEILPTTNRAAEYLRAATMTFEFEVLNNVGIERSYTYETRSGTATMGKDFVSASGFVSILAGETTGQIDVKILSDTVSEVDETFYVDVYYNDGRRALTLEGTIEDRPRDQNAPTENTPPDDDLPDMPDALGGADATRLIYLNQMQLELAGASTGNGGISLVATLDRYDGGAVGDFKLRMEMASPSSTEISFGDVVDVQARKGDAYVITASEAGFDALNEFRFDIDAIVEPEAAAPALEWTEKNGSGSGTANVDGTSQTSSGSALSVDVSIVREWANGEFLAVATVVNESSRKVNNWQLSMESDNFELEASDVHNAVVWEQNSTGLLQVRGNAWNDDLSAGESYMFSFNGLYDDNAVSAVNVQDYLDSIDFYLL